MAPSDCMIVLGSHDLRVADRAADLYHEELAPLIVVSGWRGALTKDLFTRSEAQLLAERLLARGVRNDALLLEDKATNTGENVRFSRELLAGRGIFPATAIAVQKPYMERRTLATFHKVWPELKVLVTSPQLALEELPQPGVDLRRVIEIIVGDTDRVLRYPGLGFQTAQEMPARIRDVFGELVRRGYTSRLLHGLQASPAQNAARATRRPRHLALL